jgi:amino acid transporter
MKDDAAASSPFLKSLGPLGIMMLTLSALSPVASVYISGNDILHLAGTGAALAFVLGGLIAAALALLYAELGAAFPGAGAVYPSIAGALGPGFAFPLLVVSAVLSPASVAFTAVGLASYVQVLVPGAPALPIEFGSIALATLIAVANIKTGAWVTGVFLVIEMLALLLLTGVAAVHPTRPLGEVLIHPVALSAGGGLKPTSLATLALATVAGAWSCAGASWAMYFAEEMKEARRAIGRVIAWAGLIASLTIAIPIVVVVMSAADLKAVLGSPAPLATYLARTGGPAIGLLVSLGVIAAIFNNMIAVSLGLGRFLFATGRDRVWPKPVNRLLTVMHPSWRSPIAATVLLGVLGAAACLAGERALIIILSGEVFSTLLISLAVLIGRRHGRVGAFFRSPAYPLVPLFGLAIWAASAASDYLDEKAGRPSMILLSSVFLGAVAYYLLRLRRSAGGWRVHEAPAEEPARGD